VALLAPREWETTARLVRENHNVIEQGGDAAGVLHVMAKRGDLRAVKWLLDNGADANARWSHWDADVTMAGDRPDAQGGPLMTPSSAQRDHPDDGGVPACRSSRRGAAAEAA